MQAFYYIAADLDWCPGDHVSNETFSNAPRKTFFLHAVPDEYASNPDYLARRKTELELESLRTRFYSSLPSRRDAVFLSRQKHDARKWLQRGSRARYSIYELAPLHVEALFETNYIWFNYLVRLHKNPVKENRKLFSHDIAIEIDECLTAYWTNRATEEFGSAAEIEVLFTGKLRVIRKV
jgi:hypothetical protein